jgi:hypothetical protein
MLPSWILMAFALAFPDAGTPLQFNGLYSSINSKIASLLCPCTELRLLDTSLGPHSAMYSLPPVITPCYALRGSLGTKPDPVISAPLAAAQAWLVC